MSLPSSEIWCREIREKLTQNATRTSALHDIEDVLLSVPAPDGAAIVLHLDLSQIIGCLDTAEDSAQFDLTCEVLGTCFARLQPEATVSLFAADILNFLRHESVTLRLLSVNEVYRTIHSCPNLPSTPELTEILIAVMRCIGDEELKVSAKAIGIISYIDIMDYPLVLKELSNVLDGNSSSKCNGYDVMVSIISQSPAHLAKCIEEGYVKSFMNELYTNDILFQLNVFELMARFALTTHGLNYLIENDILQNLSKFMQTLDDNPMVNILAPGLIRFFGAIAHVYPSQIFEQFPLFVETLFDGIKAGQMSVLPVCLDTLGFIGTTIEGKLSLAALGHLVPSTLKVIGEYIKTASSEVRLKAIACVSQLIGVESDPNFKKDEIIDHRVTLMTREWFRAISEHPNSIDVVATMCKLPFPDLKAAIFGLLDAICQHRWGEELVTQTPGFIEFLLDRSFDHSKDTKMMKHQIIKRFSESALIDANMIVKLKTYVNQGPYYVEHAVDVMDLNEE